MRPLRSRPVSPHALHGVWQALVRALLEVAAVRRGSQARATGTRAPRRTAEEDRVGTEMTALEQYRAAEARLHEIRRKNGGEESSEEDALLDEMDILWYALSKEEIAQLECEVAEKRGAQ